MKFELDNSAGTPIIRSYGPGEFMVGERKITTAMVIAGHYLDCDRLPATVQELTAEHLAELCALGTDLIIIGTGSRQIFLPSATVAGILARGIGCEIMTCRVYNVLVAESRSVCAVLFPVGAIPPVP
jgi:uncharacterized protein